MGRNQLRAMIIINSIALLFFAAVGAYAWTLLPVGAAARVTELDRAGVFNEDALKANFPELASNIRAGIPRWITEDTYGCAKFTVQAGMACSVLNIVMLLLFGYISKKNKPMPH